MPGASGAGKRQTERIRMKWNRGLREDTKSEFIKVLKYLFDNPGRKAKEITKFLQYDDSRTSIHSHCLTQMLKRELIRNNFGRYEITEKGMRVIGLNPLTERKAGLLAEKIVSKENEQRQTSVKPEGKIETGKQEIIVEPRRQIKITIEIT